MAVRLHFSRTWNFPPAYLHFGPAPPPIENPVATALVVAPIGATGGLIKQGIIILGGAVAPEGIAGGIVARRNMVSSFCRAKYLPQESLPIPYRGRYVILAGTPVPTRGVYQKLPPGDRKITARYGYFPSASTIIRSKEGVIDPLATAGRIVWDVLFGGSHTVRTRYGTLESVAQAGRSVWPYLPSGQRIYRTRYGYYDRPISRVWRNTYGLLTRVGRTVIVRYGLLVFPPWVWPRERRPTVPRTPFPATPHLFFYRTNDQPTTVPLHFGRLLIPPQGRRIIIMTPTCSVVRLPDRLALSVSSLSISEQIDSYAKTFSLETNWSGIQALFEGASTPTPIEATINEHVWVLVAETYTESAKFGERRYTVTGFCQAILLSSPHSELRTYTEENTRTAEQLAAQELPLDWTLSWQIVDWEVPAGMWTYQNLSPIDAISRLAQAAGAFIQSHLTDKTISILPMYATSMWAMPDATPAAILAGDVQFNVTVEWSARPDYVPYNGVFVSGTTQGVAGLIRIPGSQGERQLLVSSDSLILEISVLRERGREELSMNYPRPTLSVQVPLMPPPGSPQLIRPGDIVEVRTEYAIFRDIVVSSDISVSIQNDGLVIRQILKVGNSVANPWVAIDSLNPRSPLLSCGVLSHNADGTSTVELPGGSQIRVFGQSVAVGLRAFIQDGIVIGEAPDLPTYTLDAFDAAP